MLISRGLQAFWAGLLKAVSRGTNTKLKRSIGILIVEGLTLHTGFMVNLHVAMLQENDVGRILARDALTYRAVTNVAIDGITV